MSHREEQSYKAKNKTHWINWFIPLILVLSTFAFLVFYPVSDNIKKDSPPSVTIDNSDSQTKEIANSLVSTFFNGSDEDKNEQIRALENTLSNLKNSSQGNSNNPSSETSTDTAKKALKELKNNSINEAIETLIASANQQIDPRSSAKTWVNIGNIQNLTSAKQALLAYQKATGLDPYNSNAWNRKGHLHRQLKQFDKAEIAYKKVQQLTNKSTVNQAVSLANFGLLNQSKGDIEAAEEAFLKSLQIFTNLNNEPGQASTSENLASLYKHKNELEKAETYYLKALQIHKRNNHPQQTVNIHTTLGSLYQNLKKIPNALDHYEEALKVSTRNNLPRDTASLYSNLGILAQQNNQQAKSKEYFEKSLQINQQIKRSSGTADQYGNLAIINRNKKNYAVAEDFHNKAIQIYTQNKHQHGVISQQINLGFLYKAWNKKDKACEAWRKSLDLIQNKSNRAERVKQLLKTTCP